MTFAHPGAARPALARASFAIPAGATTAIVGESGAGKSTIVNLLLRLYAPQDGRILADGVPLEELSRTGWLARIAVAGQDVELVEGTVGENIRLARPEADDARLRAAAAAAGALAFIEALPDGFESWIGQQGLNLSGGQRQRIGIARAVLRDPDVLILDEATNALDAALEDEIHGNLRRAFAGRTLVLVTHRLEAASAADHVVRVRDGRTAEAGPGPGGALAARGAGPGREAPSCPPTAPRPARRNRAGPCTPGDGRRGRSGWDTGSSRPPSVGWRRRRARSRREGSRRMTGDGP